MAMSYNPIGYNHVFLSQRDDNNHYNLTEVCKTIAKNERNTVIHILSLEESNLHAYCYFVSNHPTDYLNALLANNIRVEVYVGSSSTNYDLRHRQHNLDRYPNHTLHFEPTFFLKESFGLLSRLDYSYEYDESRFEHYMMKLIYGYEDDHLDRLFMSLNGAPRHHRLHLLDRLYTTGLWDDGYITFYGNSKFYDNYFEEKPKFIDKPWATTNHVLPSQKHKGPNVSMFQHWFPLEARRSVISVVAETEIDLFFLTEKTAMPLLLGKPLLVYGCRNYHVELQRLGFALHDDIIDYSFDKKKHQFKRLDGIIANLINLREQYKNNYYELYKKMYPVCVHNSHQAATLAKRNFWALKVLRRFEDKDSKYSFLRLKNTPSPAQYKSYSECYHEYFREVSCSPKRHRNYHAHYPIRLPEPKIEIIDEKI
jgi:hypothetical protein